MRRCLLVLALGLAAGCASDPPPPSPLAAGDRAAPPAALAGEATPDASTPTAASAPTDAPAGVPDGPAGPGPQVDTLLGKVPGVKFLGDWTSPGCPGREYPRNLTFFMENEYAGLDLVSPCAPGAQCAWSGMVAYAGRWVQDGTTLKLRSIGGSTAPGSPHPTEVQANFEGKLVENDCEYTRGLTVPEGYAEDQVRPRLPGSK